MFAFLEKLRDPLLVWQFQYYFGVRHAPTESEDRKDGPQVQHCPNEKTSSCGAKHNALSISLPHPDLLAEGDGSVRSNSSSPESISPLKSDRSASNSPVLLERELTNGHARSYGDNQGGPQRQKGSTDSTRNGFLAPPNDSDPDGPEECTLRRRPPSTKMASNGVTSPSLHNGDVDGIAAGLAASSSDSDSGGNSSSSCSPGKSSRSAPSYIITKPFWYHLFAFGTALGDETFYSSFFPFWFWNIDGAVCRRVVTMWVVIMYIGQSLKDVIRWPRPAAPPCVRLAEKWALEFGMPSTHAMIGVAIPFSLLFYTMHRYEYPVILGVLLCSAWCCVICGSRLYLGMHTVLDIVVGLILSFLLLLVLIPCIDALDLFTLTHPYSPLFVLASYGGAILLIPSAGHWTPTRGDTVIILGVGAGFAVGSWLNYQWGIIRGPPMPPPYRILWPTYEMIGLTLLRTCIGILVVVATRALGKSLAYWLAHRFVRVDRPDRAGRLQTALELSSKFVTYMLMAFNITYLSPAVFRLLNIERATMFTEI